MRKATRRVGVSVLLLSTLFLLPTLLLLLLIAGAGAEEGCNEYVCGSVVSKCLLTQSCQCKLTDCFCCKDCLNCLGDLYTECCSCLDMCPKHNDSLNTLSLRSQIGDFEGVPELFDTLTAEDDEEEWTTIRFPIRAGLKRRLELNFAAGGGGSSHKITADNDGNGDEIDRQAAQQKKPPASVNCTVVFLNVCLSNNKCSQYCESMGASSYRWFHDGCCQCVGADCLNYGINESRCEACPEPDDEAAADELSDKDAADFEGEGDESLWDYGEDEKHFNR